MTVAPVGLLIIRAWVEEGSREPLRAEIRLTADTTLGFDPALTATDAREVQELVAAWLDEVLSRLR